MRFKDKVALIMGGSSGIGEETAKRFAAEGATVAIVASSSLEKAEGIADSIVKNGGTAKSFVTDVRNVSSIEDLVQTVTRTCGPIDILVNSAGIYVTNEIGETTEAEYNRTLDINLKGTFFTINAIVPSMKQRRTGKIINVASVAAYRGVPHYSLYCTVKAAVVMLTRTLACELAPYDININAIAPGNTATPLNEKLRMDSDLMAAKTAFTPSNRTYSAPEEMAAAILFMASEDARAMHGSTVLMDEGVSAGGFYSR